MLRMGLEKILIVQIFHVSKIMKLIEQIWKISLIQNPVEKISLLFSVLPCHYYNNAHITLVM